MGRIERQKAQLIKEANKRILKEGEGLDFHLEELAEFSRHLENGVYDKHDKLSHDELTGYDIKEIKEILQNAKEDETLSADEMTIVSEYGEGLIDDINQQSEKKMSKEEHKKILVEDIIDFIERGTQNLTETFGMVEDEYEKEDILNVLNEVNQFFKKSNRK